MVFAVFSGCKSSRAAQRLRSDDKRRIVHKPRDETMPAMKVRGTRGVGASAALIAAVALAFAAAPAWASGGAGTGKPGVAKLNAARPGPLVKGTGIAQAVRAHAVIVRQLDGSTIRVAVGPRTAVFVDGARSSLDQVKPGFVVSFAIRLGRPAIEVRARSISKPAAGAASGPTVQSVSADAVVVTRPNGSTGTLAVGSRRVFLDGSPVALSAIQPGDVVQKVNPRAVRFRRPG
jgi:hypothetical protein